MFSHVSVILTTGDPHVTITHEALDLMVQPPSPSYGHGPAQLQAWDLTVQGPPGLAPPLWTWHHTTQEP